MKYKALKYGLSFLAICLVGLIVVAVVIKVKVRRRQRLLEEQIRQAQKEEQNSQSSTNDLSIEVDNNIDSQNDLEIRLKYFNILAEGLYEAMDGIGTYYNEIEKIMSQLNSDEDWNLLNSSFGRKEGYTMLQWLKGDLSDSEIEKINLLLRRNGLTKQI